MRAVASEAGVNLASIVYYFENKEGLYLAVYRQYTVSYTHLVGLVTEQNDQHEITSYKTLLDIIGSEDFYGEMCIRDRDDA